jgi:hypothetical protein
MKKRNPPRGACQNKSAQSCFAFFSYAPASVPRSFFFRWQNAVFPEGLAWQ